MELPDLWNEFYSQHLMALLPKGVHWYWPNPPYYTGYEMGTLFDWDQYFEGLLLLYAGFPAHYLKNSIRIFLRMQHDDGFIPRAYQPGNPAAHGLDMVKPFLAQELVLCLQAEGTLAWVRKEDRYERMCRYLEKWWTGLDRRGGGLSVWRNAGHTGMDNHYERAGRDDASFCEGVDLNAYLVREADAMAIVAGALGKAQDQARFTEQARARARGMRDTMWDDADGIFYDHHALEDRPIKVKHVGIFAALWAGVATEAQAERLVREHLLNESEFWRPYPLPALSASEPGYVEGFLPGNKTGCCSWRAHTWMPTNYYAFQGLRRYGFLEEAQLLADRSWELFLRGRFSEYFTSETGIGTGRKSFGGWTGLVLFLHPELLLGLDPTALEPDNRALGAMRRWLIEQDA